jgi:hypothetical protein
MDDVISRTRQELGGKSRGEVAVEFSWQTSRCQVVPDFSLTREQMIDAIVADILCRAAN